jgi:hypothetical protein
MDLETAIERLSNAVHEGTGASAGAATVLLFAWNSVHPMRELLSLDMKNRAAALIVIEAALGNRLNGGQTVENIVGTDDIKSFNRSFGIHGAAWQG